MKLACKQERLQVQPNRFNEAGMQASGVTYTTERLMKLVIQASCVSAMHAVRHAMCVDES